MNYLCVKNRGEGEKKKFNIVSGLEEVYKRGCRPVIRIVLQLRRGRRLFRSHVVLRPLPRIFIGRLYEFRKLQQLQQVLYLYKWASFYTLLPDRYRNLLPSLLSFSDTKLKTCVARDPTSLLHLNNALLIWQLRMWVIKLRMRVIFGQYITIIYLFICTGTYRWIANLWKMSNCIWGMSRVTIFQNCIVPSRYQGPWIELELYKLYNNFFFNTLTSQGLESYLLILYRRLDIPQSYDLFERTYYAKKIIKYLHNMSFYFPFIKPFIYFLESYMRLLRGRKSTSQACMARAEKYAIAQGNKMVVAWIEQNKRVRVI